MNHIAVPAKLTSGHCLIASRVLACLTSLIFCCMAALAQSTNHAPVVTAGHSVRVTHILGFVGARNNASGTLSIQVDTLQFQSSGKPAAEVKIASVQDVVVGELSKQVGGLPMTMGKAAAPYGGGRVVSLFTHKKYDTLALRYVDAEGGIHGAIFQLQKGEGELLRKELVAKGASVSQRESTAMRQRAAEVSSANK
ncbi:MAG: hypothetical protein WA817_05310 [Candidatus Acidiferrum sp.]